MLKLHHDWKKTRVKSISVRGASLERNEMQKKNRTETASESFRIIFSSFFMLDPSPRRNEKNRTERDRYTYTHALTWAWNAWNAFCIKRVFIYFFGFMINLYIITYHIMARQETFQKTFWSDSRANKTRREREDEKVFFY